MGGDVYDKQHIKKLFNDNGFEYYEWEVPPNDIYMSYRYYIKIKKGERAFFHECLRDAEVSITMKEADSLRESIFRGKSLIEHTTIIIDKTKE